MKTEEIISETDRCALLAPRAYQFCMLHVTQALENICDGVDSSSSWIQRLLVPNTVLGQNITPVSNIHDWRYTLALYYPWISVGEQERKAADDEFLENCKKLFRNTRFEKLKTFIVSKIHYPLLRKYGSRAFWNAKLMPRDWEDGKIPSHCENLTRTSLNAKQFVLGAVDKYKKYREVYEFVRKEMKAKA